MEDIRTIYANRLKSLHRNTTPRERAEALQFIGISRPTLEKYLSGDICKMDTAVEIIRFLTGKVNQRINELRESNVA